MPLNDTLIHFLRDVVKGLGEFAPKYVTPLRAFRAMVDEPQKIQSVIERGLTIEGTTARLDKILAEDAFLAECCGDIDHLAHVLDILFFKQLPESVYTRAGMTLGLGFAPDPFDRGIEKLEESLYGGGAFSKTAYFHLFNFWAQPQDYPPRPYRNWGFVQLEFKSVASLLGEQTLSSFLCPPSAGNFFLTIQDPEGFNHESLNAWLDRRWADVGFYRQVLQYSRAKIIDVDYVVPYFNPPWANQIHRGGLFYSGAPRKDKPPPNLWYYVSSWDAKEIQRHWLTFQQYKDRIKAQGSTLRKALRIAGDFFEDCHKKTSRIEQFADLMIALEALYTPSDASEHTFRISQSCALLIEDSLEKREATFEFLRAMFKRRGKLFHGQYDISSQAPQDFISDDDLEKLISIVRISILKFQTLYLRGEEQLDKVRKDLERAILDESFRSDFLEKADFETLMGEFSED